MLVSTRWQGESVECPKRCSSNERFPLLQVRETFRWLLQHNMVDCVVTTAGGIEEDFIKCLAPTYIGDFHLKGAELRDKGINRIANLLGIYLGLALSGE